MNRDTSPIGEYKTIVVDSGGSYTNRLFIGTPTTGTVRIEWAAARWGATIPMNWSNVQMLQFIHSYIPLRYQVADAQNLIVKACLEQDMQWLLLIEHDVVLPPDAYLTFNRYITEESHPVVSGLYYVRGIPSYPMTFRGRGTGVYTKWQMGDLVYCDGVPTGCLLIHSGILREMWNDSEAYQVPGPTGDPVTVRRVFNTPRDVWYDPEDSATMYAAAGTSDLAWCSRVIKGGYLKRAGWPEFQRKKYPFLVDTNIFCRHIDPDGTRYPDLWWQLQKENEQNGNHKG